MTRMAACSCGQLRVTCSGDPLRVAMCHCLECQKRTGSLFGVAARWKADDVKTEGRSTTWLRISDKGNRLEFHFCPVCGTTLYWQQDARPGTITVAAGAFADPDFPVPAIQVYENRRHRWLTLGDIPEYRG